MRLERLSPGEILSAIAALTLLGLMSGIWFEHPTAADIDAGAIGFQTEPNAWRAFAVIDVVLVATIVCTLSAAVVAAAGSKIPLPLSGSAVVTLLGALSMALLAYRIADPIEVAGISYRRDLPLFLGFGMTGLVTLGGVMAMLAEGTSIGEQVSRAARGRGEHREQIKLDPSD